MILALENAFKLYKDGFEYAWEFFWNCLCPLATMIGIPIVIFMLILYLLDKRDRK